MKPTPTICADLREDTLDELGRSAGFKSHADDCTACQDWLVRQSKIVGVLRSLDRHVAPREMEGAAEFALQVGTTVLAEDLRSLERFEAPGELAEMLAINLAEPVWIQLLTDLPQVTAPDVLDRLVAEELQDHPAAVTRRFAGGLFRKQGPVSLTEQVAAGLAQPAGPQASHAWLKPLMGLAAAVFVVGSVGFFGNHDEPKVFKPSFTVVEVESLASVSPFGGALIRGLAGVQSASESLTDGGQR